MKRICFKATPEHFWSMVAISDPDSCWEWQGCRSKKGYGNLHYTELGEDKSHRVAYRLTNGNIPVGMCILHKCDNRACCNPNHLYVGDNDQNVKDRMARGRAFSQIGVNNPNVKLTEWDVAMIKRLRASGMSALEVSDQYSITRTSVYNICGGRSWKSLSAQGGSSESSI